jgi:hypothetical protein
VDTGPAVVERSSDGILQQPDQTVMSSFIDDGGPDLRADNLAVMFAQASDPRRNQHASQGGSLPLVDLALAVLLPSSRLDATLVEVERDAAQRLALQDSADSLADGVGLSRFQLLANVRR